ncbi:MAG TPA: hypothetical protein VF713_07105 [Thermoanaerobaculia bacterium]
MAFNVSDSSAARVGGSSVVHAPYMEMIRPVDGWKYSRSFGDSSRKVHQRLGGRHPSVAPVCTLVYVTTNDRRDLCRGLLEIQARSAHVVGQLEDVRRSGISKGEITCSMMLATS